MIILWRRFFTIILLFKTAHKTSFPLSNLHIWKKAFYFFELELFLKQFCFFYSFWIFHYITSFYMIGKKHSTFMNFCFFQSNSIFWTNSLIFFKIFHFITCFYINGKKAFYFFELVLFPKQLYFLNKFFFFSQNFPFYNVLLHEWKKAFYFFKLVFDPKQLYFFILVPLFELGH